MAYSGLDGDAVEFLRDVAGRREFRASDSGAAEAPEDHPFGVGLPAGPAGPPESALGPGLRLPGLRLQGAQMFVRNFASPDTPYTRLLLNWKAGTGKTLGAIAISQEFARVFRSDVTSPRVFVIGFTRAIIQAEMLRHPELGFASAAELTELQRLRRLADGSAPGAPEARRLAGYISGLRRRVTDPARGGMYRFFGYREFADSLLEVTPRGSARGFTIAKLYKTVGDSTASCAADSDAADGDADAFVDRIEAAVEAGDVRVNETLLDEMRGGLIVCDEIHNTYNMSAENNYGVAIQYMLDRLGPAAPRAVFMTATVTGGSATEIVDLLNFLVPVSRLPDKRRLRRRDFFDTRPGPPREDVLRPGALEQIGRLSAGRVSFLLPDGSTYPRRIFEGESLAGIPYLKFVSCPMSDFHENTLRRAFDLAGTAGQAERIAIPTNAYALYDMVYPNPDLSAGAAARRDVPEQEWIGLYQPDAPGRLASAAPAWKTAAGVTVGTLGRPGSGVPLVGGAFLAAPGSSAKTAPVGLGAYSGKYSRLVGDLREILRGGPGKVMVYHHRVRMTGVLQIQEALIANGFVAEGASVSGQLPGTLCGICGLARRDHTAAAAKKTWKGPHAFAPARFAIVNSEVDRAEIERSLARFNEPANREGGDVRVLVGSKIIREGFDLKAVRFQLIASLPTDIPTLIQVLGRAARHNSHAGLPEDQRDVRVRIYVSTGKDGLSPEVERYSEKMKAYKVSQEVERAIRRYAVDGFLRHAVGEAATLEALPFEPVVSASMAESIPESTDTYMAYGYADEEAEMLKAVIRALFGSRPVWMYEDLWEAAQTRQIQGAVRFGSAGYSEKAFARALEELGRHRRQVLRAGVGQSGAAAASESTIAYVAPYYVRAPVTPEGQPVVDVESYVRDNAGIEPVRVRVADFVSRARRGVNFEVRLREFAARFGGAKDPENIEDALVDFDADFHTRLLEMIVGAAQPGAAQPGAAREPNFARALKRSRELYDRFKILVSRAQSRDVARPSRSASRLPNDAPVGYIGEKAARLYGGPETGWYDVPRADLGVSPRQRENDTIVGYAEPIGSGLKFKIRRPIHVLEAADVRDSRSVARGAVCTTRSRRELEELAAALGAKAGETTSPALCRAIRRRLLEREEAARAKKNGMRDGLRWFYLFNDPRPVPRAARAE